MSYLIMHLTLDTPWYFVLLCLLLGAGYAALLYFFRTKKEKEADSGVSGAEGLSKKMTWWLSALRCLTVTLIAFLLLSPLVKRHENEREKPIIIIAQDNTKSLDYSRDSAFYHTTLPKEMEKLYGRLAKDYDIQCYTYGSEVRQLAQDDKPDYADKSTDMGAMMKEIADRYANRNVGAVLLTGDGLYNQGEDPTTLTPQLPYPIYTLALGDTTARRDAAVSHVKYNKIAYLDNQFPIEITVRAGHLQGQTRQLTVTHNGKQLFSKGITYTNNNFTTTETVLLNADHAGLQQYVIHIAVTEGESSVRNNTYVLPIEVIDGHQKIAIIAAVPHPDVSALKRSIETRQNYKVEAFLAKDFKGSFKDYDMIILHQLPAKGGLGGDMAQRAMQAKVPLMFVVGGMSDLGRLNAMHTGLEIYSKLDRGNEATPLYNNSFTAFTLEDEIARRVEAFPPLVSPFGNYRTGGNTQVLLTAKIGNVNSGQPLVAVSQQQALRYSFVAGEGLWKWRLADFQQNGNNESFDEMLSKLVTYTALQVNKDRFHVNAKKVWGENEDVVLEAELYDENYEPVNQPEVSLQLTHSMQQVGDDGKGNTSTPATTAKSSTYKFNKEGTGYTLNLGRLAPGQYHYTANTTYNGRQLKAQGVMMVEDANLEDLNLEANHALLNTLAVTTGGKMLYPKQLSQLPDLLKKRGDITPIIYSHQHYSELVHLPLVFILLVLLLGAEWALRKYNGEI